MKKKIFLLTVVVSICSFAINYSEASAYTKDELRQLCQTMGGTWSESSLKCTGGGVNSSSCSSYGGSYSNPTSNGHDFTPTCSWTYGSLDSDTKIANCIMAGSGTETQAICAGKISRAATGADSDSSTTGGDGSIADVSEGQCTSILPGGWCDGKDGIGSIINMIVSILTGAVVVAGTIGIIICGFLWMTARDNEAQVAMAKKRMLDIVIGIVAWVLLALIANLFIPKSSGDIQTDIGYNGGSSKDIEV